MPSCTVAGAFGIARTTGISPLRWRSMAPVGIAAATDNTVCSGVMRPVTEQHLDVCASPLRRRARVRASALSVAGTP
jgi:hypothetical protein